MVMQSNYWKKFERKLKEISDSYISPSIHGVDSHAYTDGNDKSEIDGTNVFAGMKWICSVLF